MENIKDLISEAIKEMKRIYDNPDSSLSEMAEVMDYASLLNCTDFVRSITD